MLQAVERGLPDGGAESGELRLGARAMGREAGWVAMSCAGGTVSRKAQGLRGQLGQPEGL